MAKKPRTTRPMRQAFTLVEILVVVSIIVLMMAVAIPSISQLFSGGADAQAYNVIAAQLAAARALAIQKQTYAGVHVQLADSSILPKLANACFAAVVWDDPNITDPNFTLAPGFFPRRLPGGMTLGQLVPPYVIDGNYEPNVSNLNFYNFTIVFSPSGQLVGGKSVTYSRITPFAYGGPTDKTYLWAWTATPALSVKGMVLFDGDKFFPMPLVNRLEFLNKGNGQVIGVNWYTGAVLGR